MSWFRSLFGKSNKDERKEEARTAILELEPAVKRLEEVTEEFRTILRNTQVTPKEPANGTN